MANMATANDGVIAWWKGPDRPAGPVVKVGDGVTNDPGAFAKMLERRRLAGDVLSFASAVPRDRGEFQLSGAATQFDNAVRLP
jgi:hypothetical protein